MKIAQYRHFVYLLLLASVSVLFMSWTLHKMEKTASVADLANKKAADRRAIEEINASFLFDSLGLEEKGLSQQAFTFAVQGLEKLEENGALHNDSILTIIDFDQPSYQKRLYVIDLRNYKLLFQTLVAHGKNTGREQARYFSNRLNSHQSSLGFYVTDHTYYGSHGLSLKLIGLEKNINSQAYKRAIVMHGADYVSQSFIDAQGYIGRSFGCPAIPMAFTQQIIRTIQGGSCLFIYHKGYSPSPDFKFS